MKRATRIFKSIMLPGLALLLITGLAIADQHGEGEAGMPEMGPPKQMEEVKNMVGTWKVEEQHRMDPSQEWQTSEATCTYEMGVGGAALIMHYEGNMMGMPYKGMGIQAYNREDSEWQTAWIDNMSGRISLYTGHEKDGKMVFTGTDKWQGQEYLARITVHNMEEDSFDWKYEMSMDGGENWMTSMKSHYTRH